MPINPRIFKQVRRALGLSQAQLADRLQLSRVTVNKMERGRLARGIPDEIADRLLALKAQHAELEWPSVAWMQQPEAADVPFGRVPSPDLHSDDNHLWDNEEDDQ